MGNRLQIIRALYGETGEDAVDRSSLFADEKLKAEHDGLAQVKESLDSRASNSPSERTLNAIIAEAKSAHPGGARQPLMRLLTLSSTGSSLMRVALAACTLFVAVAIGLRVGSDEILPDESSQLVLRDEAEPAEERMNLAGAETDAPAVADGRSREDRLAQIGGEYEEAPVDDLMSRRSVAKTVAPEADGDSSEMIILASEADALMWEGSDEFRSLRSRIEMLERSNQELNWDDAVAPLEALPAGPGAAAGVRLRQAGAGNNR